MQISIPAFRRVSIFFVILTSLVPPLSSADAPWPPAAFTQVRAYAFSMMRSSHVDVIRREDMSIATSVINEEGARLSDEQVKRLMNAITGRHKNHSRAACYEPHNAIVFYDANHKPVAFVEICFDCFGYTAAPKGTAVMYDLPELALLFEELKLPIGKHKNSAALKKALDAMTKADPTLNRLDKQAR